MQDRIGLIYQTVIDQSDVLYAASSSLPTWLRALTIFTAIFIISLRARVYYVYGVVVATLAMVEAPPHRVEVAPRQSKGPNLNVAPETEKNVDKNLAPVEPELILARQAPVTAGIRTTTRLLLTQGRFPLLSGIILYFASSFATTYVEHALEQYLVWAAPGTRTYAAAFLATTLSTPFLMVWIHLTISRPSPGRWQRLIPSHTMLLKATPATAVYAFAEGVTIALPIAFCRQIHFGEKVMAWANDEADFTRRDAIDFVLQLLAVVVVANLGFLLMRIPALVTMTRVHASLLPETEEALLPFDRTFDGHLLSESDGGSGKLGILDAWRSFGWGARFRLLKLYAKVVGLEVYCLVLFCIVLSKPVQRFLFE